MKRFALSLMLILITALPASAMPEVVARVAQNRELFLKIWGYDDHMLHDVNRLDAGRVGVVMLTAVGFELRLVFDAATGKEIYKDTILAEKSRREEMERQSISVRDAKKLARALEEREGQQKATQGK